MLAVLVGNMAWQCWLVRMVSKTGSIHRLKFLYAGLSRTRTTDPQKRDWLVVLVIDIDWDYWLVRLVGKTGRQYPLTFLFPALSRKTTAPRTRDWLVVLAGSIG